MASAFERWAEFKGQVKAWFAEGAKDLHNHVVPAFPTYVHGVDEPGTPLNMGGEAARPNFEQTMARQAPPLPSQAKVADTGMEL